MAERSGLLEPPSLQPVIDPIRVNHVRRVVEKNLSVYTHIRYSEPDAGEVDGLDDDSSGQVNMSLLKRMLPVDDYRFYFCEPPPFMKSVYYAPLLSGLF